MLILEKSTNVGVGAETTVYMDYFETVFFFKSKAPTKGKRGRPASKQPKAKPGPKPKKAKADKEGQPAEGTQEKIDESFKKVKRKIDRFKGMSEEEVMKKTLPDILTYNLDYVIVSVCLFLCLCVRVKDLNVFKSAQMKPSFNSTCSSHVVLSDYLLFSKKKKKDWNQSRSDGCLHWKMVPWTWKPLL